MLYPVLLVAYRDKALLRIKKHLPETKFWEVFYPCESESPRMGGGGVGEGKVSPRKSVVQSACQYDVTSRVSAFQNGKQSVHRRDG